MGSGKITSNAESRSVATKRNVSPRSKTSRTLPLRSFLIPGRLIVDCGEVCILKTLNAQRSTFNVQLRAMRWTLSVGRWTFAPTLWLESLSNPARAFCMGTTGLLKRSPQDSRKTGGWRRDFAEGRKRSFDWQCDLQFQIANYRPAFLATAAGSRF